MSEARMVERVARAIIVHADAFASITNTSKYPPTPSRAGWTDYSKVEQAAALMAAKAVLREMHEPSRAMIDSVADKITVGSCNEWNIEITDYSAAEVYTTMIDAALSDA